MFVPRAIALIAFASFAVVLTQEHPRKWMAPQVLCNLDNAAVNESSGVAASGLKSGVFFTHNDSGDSPRFFRFDKTGKVDGEYRLEGASAIDWEDMARATLGQASYLYLGDVGDNAEKRESIVVYRTQEPTEAGKRSITSFETYTIKYPDKPHNCEALFVTSAGDIWVVTKNPGGISKAFVLRKPPKSGSYTFKHVADIKVDTGGFGGKLVTGGDVSPDGKYVAIRTYSAALEFEVPNKFDDWTKSVPTPIRLPLETQGEAIGYSKDGSSLVTTSEFAPCPVSVIPLARN